LFYPWLVSAAYLDRIPPQQLAKEVEATARTFGEWDANSLVLRYAAYRAHDVSGPYEGDMAAALAQIAAPTLVLTSASDRLAGMHPMPSWPRSPTAWPSCRPARRSCAGQSRD